MDGVNDYTCKCSGDYTGKYCEIAPVVAMLYPQTSPCQQHDCKNGICFQPMGSNDYICKCAQGYAGMCLLNLYIVKILQICSEILG